MRSIKHRLVVSLLFPLGAILITWLLQGESSPLAGYFLWNVRLPNFWALLNAPSFIAAAVLSGSHAGGPLLLLIILQFIQWFVVGFVLLTLFSIVFRRNLR